MTTSGDNIIQANTAISEINQYLKNDSGFERLMSGMFDLYNRYGRCFSAVRLPRPSLEEERALSVFFKRDYYDQALIRIGLAEFERQIQKVFSCEVGLDTVLVEYFGRQISSQNDHVLSDSHRYKDAFTRAIRDDLLPRFEDTYAAVWLREMLAHMRRTYRLWADQFPHEPDNVLAMVTAVCEALNVLPEGQLVRLSDFTTKYFGDPRALDYHSPYGPLFLRALAHKYDAVIPAVLEDSIRLYLQAGLLSDGVLSQVTLRGLKADDEACIFYDQLGEAHVLTLENICRLGEVKAYGEKVFIVENPHVFSALCERLSGFNCTLVCAMDGLNPALEYLLDQMILSGAVLYYAGNIDYKGLTLADKIYLRYGKSFIPWRYGRTDYELLFTGSDFLLPDDRKDLAMHNEELASLLSLLRKKGKSASSFPLVGVYAEDIMAILGPSEFNPQE
ncbi:MAG: TIGR02679 domain-containing protein [Defluviitaleaceae bacterium]|nr:TIGR02679 domain-containing protein [Defluviitaleaceae bacterium]